MRFRPSGGLGSNQKGSDRAAQEARAQALGDRTTENVYDRGRFSKEIERAENLAAGLPAEGEPAVEAAAEPGKKDFRQPHLDTPAEVKEETYTPVPLKEPKPQGLVESLKGQGKHYDASMVELEYQDAWKNADTKLRIEDL